MGRDLLGVYHLLEDRIYLYVSGGRQGSGGRPRGNVWEIGMRGGGGVGARRQPGLRPAALRETQQTPVFFGSAVNNFGVRELLSAFVKNAAGPLPRPALERVVQPDEPKFTGFVFKIQANMDPGHRDRIAFVAAATCAACACITRGGPRKFAWRTP